MCVVARRSKDSDPWAKATQRRKPTGQNSTVEGHCEGQGKSQGSACCFRSSMRCSRRPAGSPAWRTGSRSFFVVSPGLGGSASAVSKILPPAAGAVRVPEVARYVLRFSHGSARCFPWMSRCNFAHGPRAGRPSAMHSRVRSARPGRPWARLQLEQSSKSGSLVFFCRVCHRRQSGALTTSECRAMPLDETSTWLKTLGLSQ